MKCITVTKCKGRKGNYNNNHWDLVNNWRTILNIFFFSIYDF